MVRKKRGYTLLEMLMTVAILGVVSATAAPLLVQMTNFWRLTTARFSIQRDVRVSIDTINRFTRQGLSNSVVIDRAAGQPPFSRITFNYYGPSGDTQPISFYQSGNKLLMLNNGKETMLSSNLGYIGFTYPRSDDVSIISVAMTMQSPTYRGGKKALQLSIQKVRIMN